MENLRNFKKKISFFGKSIKTIQCWIQKYLILLKNAQNLFCDTLNRTEYAPMEAAKTKNFPGTF